MVTYLRERNKLALSQSVGQRVEEVNMPELVNFMEVEGLNETELIRAFRRINAFIRSHHKKVDYSGETRWQAEVKLFLKVYARLPLERKDITDYYPKFTRGVSKLLESLQSNSSDKQLEAWSDYRKKYSNIHICRTLFEHIQKSVPENPPKLSKTMAGIIGDLQDKLIFEMQKEKIDFFQQYKFRNRRKEKIKEIVSAFFEHGFCEY